jgi:hypothetical protein
MSIATGPTSSQVRFEAVKERLRNAASQESAPEVQWCQFRTMIQSWSQALLLNQWDVEIGSFGIIGFGPSAAGMEFLYMDEFEEDADWVIFLMHEALARKQNGGVEGDSCWGLIVSKWREQIQGLLEFFDSVSQDVQMRNMQMRNA